MIIPHPFLLLPLGMADSPDEMTLVFESLRRKGPLANLELL